jgi:hypothetical protein
MKLFLTLLLAGHTLLAQEIVISANPDLLYSTANDYGPWGAPEFLNSPNNDYGPLGSPEFISSVTNEYGFGVTATELQLFTPKSITPLELDILNTP